MRVQKKSLMAKLAETAHWVRNGRAGFRYLAIEPTYEAKKTILTVNVVFAIATRTTYWLAAAGADVSLMRYDMRQILNRTVGVKSVVLGEVSDHGPVDGYTTLTFKITVRHR